MRKYLLLIYFILISLHFSVQAQNHKAAEAIENSLEPYIQVKGKVKKYNLLKRMEYYKVPGVSIAVVRNGKISWAKGYGLANTKTGSKVEVNTMFQAGSISKPLAALAALKLVQEGKLDLDKDVNNYLKGWKIPKNTFTKNKKVTLRGLLTHSAGVTVHGFPGYTQKDRFPDIITVLNGKGNTSAIRVDMEPGTRFRYSGGGYTIMEKIVEDVAGMPLEKYMARYILKPMEMSNSTYAQPLPKKYHKQASAAYNRKGKIINGLWHNYPEQAAAGLWTTPTDLAKYCIEIQNILKGKKKGILSQKIVKQMLTKHKNNRGLGPQLSFSGDSLMFGHGGKNAGFTNDLRAFAHLGDAIIIMTSGDNGGRLMREIKIAASKYYGWGIQPNKTVTLLNLSKAQLKPYVGKYKFNRQVDGKDYIVEVKIKKGKLVFYDLPLNDVLKLEALSNTEFINLARGNRIVYKKAKNEKEYALYWNGRYRFDKIK